jgi:hypothetical protein
VKNLIKKILLQEGRVEDVKKRYPEHEETVDFFVNNDPSGNNKYLQWMMKQVVKNGAERGFVSSLVRHFHRNVQRLQKKDINQYKTLKQLQDALSTLGTSKSQMKKKVKREGTKVLYEDDTMLVLKPLNHQASCQYGTNTKWCLAMKENDSFFNHYTRKGSRYAGIDWIESKEIVKDIKQTWWRKLFCLPPKEIEREIVNFRKDLPVNLVYFVIMKKYLVDSEWDDKLKRRVPIYKDANESKKTWPYYRFAVLIKPSRAEFGDVSKYNLEKGDWMRWSGAMIDAAMNGMDIYNAWDQKVSLRDISKLHWHSDQFGVALRFIENDAQKVKQALYNLTGVWGDLGGEGSKDPITWITSDTGYLYGCEPNEIKGEKGGTLTWSGQSHRYGIGGRGGGPQDPGMRKGGQQYWDQVLGQDNDEDDF